MGSRSEGLRRSQCVGLGFQRFLVDGSGNVAVIFALASLPLLAFAGAALDYGTATRMQAKLQAATDATALSLCQTPSTTTTAQMQTQAQVMMAGYMGAAGLTVDPISRDDEPAQDRPGDPYELAGPVRPGHQDAGSQSDRRLRNARRHFRRRSRSPSCWIRPAR